MILTQDRVMTHTYALLLVLLCPLSIGRGFLSVMKSQDYWISSLFAPFLSIQRVLQASKKHSRYLLLQRNKSWMPGRVLF